MQGDGVVCVPVREAGRETDQVIAEVFAKNGGFRRTAVDWGFCTRRQAWRARPSTARAASRRASERVGWAWQVRAMSSLVAPNSMAAAASAIMSPARGPRMCTPRTRSVWASARIFTEPSTSPSVRARPLARKEKRPLRKARPDCSRLLLGPADAGDLGVRVDHGGDRFVVDVAVAGDELLDAGDAFVGGLVGEHGLADAVADGVDARALVA